MQNEFERIYKEKINELNEKLEYNRIIKAKYENARTRYEQYKTVDKPNAVARFLKLSSVKKYQDSIIEYESLKKEYEELEKALNELESDQELIKKVYETEDELEAAREDISIVFNYYRENGIPIVLTKKDLDNWSQIIKKSHDKDAVFKETRNIEKLEDIVLVHKTNFAPVNEEIGTRMSSNVIDTTDVRINGTEYKINIRPGRNSVHFSVNHEVASNGGGNWDECKYAVLVPLLSIPKEQFASNNVVDTFTNGKVELTNESIIICPNAEMETVKKNNPDITIVGYEGNSVTGYADVLMWMLGYSVEKGNDWGLDDTVRQNKYSALILNSGYSSIEHHYYTKAREIERKNYLASFIVGVLELIKNSPELQNIDTKTIISDSQINDFLYHCNEDTSELFNYYLSEIGIEKHFPAEGINHDNYMNYCVELVEAAKELGKEKLKTM